MSPHRVLGVTPDASPTEVKRAYRRLAMVWHPDRNDHPEATERFKKIRAAYDALAGREDERAPPAAPDSESGESSRTDEGPRAPDLRFDLDLDLEEAAAGVQRTIELVRGKPCATCAGSGEAGISRSRMCEPCHGSGRVRRRGHALEQCSQCQGKGFFSERICPDCGGLGRDEEDVSLLVSVPPGMLAGDELRLSGQGESARDGMLAGDLYLTLRLRQHELFRLDGRDLLFDMPVSVLTLLAGGELPVPGLGGVERLEVVAGTIEQRRVILPGKGYPGRNGSPAGDLVVTLIPIMPRELSLRQRELLQQADAAFDSWLDESLPEVAAWRRRFIAE